MTTDVRLLSTYQGFAPQSIISLPDATATALIGQGGATTTLTGGTRAYRLVANRDTAAQKLPIGVHTVTQNQQMNVLIPEGQIVTMTGDASAAATVTRNGSADTWTIGASGVRTIGPYLNQQILVVSCTAGTVQAENHSAGANAPQLIRNPSGQIKGFSGAGATDILLPQARSRKGSILFDFSDTANWLSQSGGVTRSGDAAMAKRSASAIKCVFGAGATSDGIKKTFTNKFIIQSGTAMNLAVYIDPATFGSTTATIKFSSDALATKSLAFSITNNYLRPGWNYVPLRAGEDGTYESQAGTAWVATGGQAWGDQFNYFEIVFSGLASKTCWLDSFIVGAKPVPRWSFSTDGTDASILSVMAPAFAANGWTGCAFIDGDSTTVNAYAPTLQTLINTYGWEIGTQGIGHTSYSGREAQLAIDWDVCVANFLAAGLPAPKMFAYPLNTSTNACDNVLAGKGVIWRRGAGNPVLNSIAAGCPNAPDGLVRGGWNQLLGTNLNTGTSYSQLVNRIAALKFTGGIQHFFTHTAKSGTPDSLGIDLTQFYQWCDLMKAAEFTDGFQNVQCSQSKAILDSEVFF